MSSSTPKAFTAAVITVSDSRSRGTHTDTSGPALADLLRKRNFSVVGTEIVPDERANIEKAILHWVREARFVLTTGGTGVAERDVTPEATRAVCDRLLEGVAERMRSAGHQKTPLAILSRGICGICQRSIVLNLPGSPNGAVESLESVIDVIPHALKLLAGETEHG
jgi:molybdenum cofactor synthesis domain-containing protein